MAGVGARLAQQAGLSVGRLVRAQGAALARLRHPRRAGHAQLARLPHGVVARALLLGPRQAAQEQPPEPHPRPWPGGAYIRGGGAGRGGMGDRKPYGLYMYTAIFGGSLVYMWRRRHNLEAGAATSNVAKSGVQGSESGRMSAPGEGRRREDAVIMTSREGTDITSASEAAGSKSFQNPED